MEVIRNSINIIGLASSDKLPNDVNDQTIQYSESETIFIPNDKAEIGNIFEIMIEIEILSKRIVDTNINRTVILDGIKKYKIIYSEESSSKANILYLNKPYNTFIEIPKNKNISSSYVFIIDAYFSKLATRKIYSHLVLLLDVNYSKNDSAKNQEVNQESIIIEKNIFKKEDEMIY